MISKKINYFLTLAECLSFTQTAARFEVSQTAVSQYIAALEERIGVRLFDRNRHSVTLTEAGRYYYQHVRELQTNYNAVLDHTHVIAAGYHGSLKVGVGMYEYRSTESLFSAFLTEHPEIRVDILQYPYSTLSEMLRAGELDVIIADSICEGEFSKREILVRPLFASENSIVADPVIAERNGGDVLKMLREECLITNCESGGPSSLKMLSTLLLDEYGLVPEKISQTNSINAQLMLVRAKHGIAIVPDFIADAQCPDLERYPFPSGRKTQYELMYLSNCENEAAELLFSFSKR